MSNKLRKMMNKPARKNIIVEEKTKPKLPQNLINESVIINPNDKEMIYHYIEQPGNAQYVLSTYSDTFDETDRTIIFSRTMGTGNRVIVIFHSELEEISDFIIEMCDQMGWNFLSGIQEETGKIIFEILVR